MAGQCLRILCFNYLYRSFRPDCPQIAPGVTLTGATPSPPAARHAAGSAAHAARHRRAGLTPGGAGGLISGLLGAPLPPFAPPGSPGASIPDGGTKCNYSGGISFTVYAGQTCPPVNGQPPISTSSAPPPDMKQDLARHASQRARQRARFARRHVGSDRSRMSPKGHRAVRPQNCGPSVRTAQTVHPQSADGAWRRTGG